EIQVTGRAEITGTTTLTLGFLDLEAQMQTAANGAPLNFVTANLSANLDGLGDGKLSLPELLNLGNIPQILGLNKANAGLALNLQANLDIALNTSINPD